MSEHFNNLTPAQAERFDMLAEECAEVIQACMKIKRHGMKSYHPDTGVGNMTSLMKEIWDVQAVARAIGRSDFHLLGDATDMDEAWAKKLRYSHHQEPAP